MKALHSISAIILCLISFALITSSLVAEESDTEFNESYKKIDNPGEFMASEFSKAKEENKKLIFVLGGNWCHDSLSLAKKLKDATLAKTIETNYRISLVDVGFLNQGFEFTEKANKLTFYATPTVLIFDAETEKQLNSNDMHIWAQADLVSQEDANAYFDSYANDHKHIANVNMTEEQKTAMNKLEKFTNIQEQRIKTSYLIVGPLLEKYEAGDKNEKFGEYWKALANLRMQLPKDIKNIQQQITAISSADLANIEYPSYEALPWE